MPTKIKILLAVVVAISAISGFALWNLTHTPYGRMDIGAALIAKSMSYGSIEITPQQRRIANDFSEKLMGTAPEDVAISDRFFVSDGNKLRIRIYEPKQRHSSGVIVWYHGGGFFMGEKLEIWDGPCARIANEAGALLVSIDYRLAPENPFPAAIIDSWNGLLWVSENATELGANPSKIAVMGSSAGGNISAVMALRSRDEKGPTISLQVLTVPSVNAGGEPTKSLAQFATGYGFAGGEEIRAAYFRRPEDMLSPWASPMLASNLEGLPPAVIHTAEFDPLRDEGELYAKRLENAGVEVDYRSFKGTIHGFVGSDGDLRESERLAAQAIRKAFEE